MVRASRPPRANSHSRVSECTYASAWCVAVSTTENVSEAASTPSTTTISRPRSRAASPRAASTTGATSSGQTRKNWPWIDNDQKCCTGLDMALRAA